MIVEDSRLAGPRGNRLDFDAGQLRGKDDVLFAATIVAVVYDFSTFSVR